MKPLHDDDDDDDDDDVDDEDEDEDEDEREGDDNDDKVSGKITFRKPLPRKLTPGKIYHPARPG